MLRDLSALFLIIFCAACSFTFDGEEADVVLVGPPPALDGYPRLNRAAASGYAVLRDPAGAPVAMINETPIRAGLGDLTPTPGAQPLPQTWRLVALQGPPAEETLTFNGVSFIGDTLYLFTRGQGANDPTTLVIRPPCAGCSGSTFPLPPRSSVIPSERAFAVLELVADATQFTLLRVDGSFARTLPLPAGTDPLRPLDESAFFFDRAGSNLFVQGPDGSVVIYSTTTDAITRPGLKLGRLLLDGKFLYSCGKGGLVQVPWQGGEAAVLDESACDGSLFGFVDQELLYLARPRGVAELQLRAVSVSPVQTPVVRLASAPGQVLAVDGDAVSGAILYSKDAPTRFGGGIGDGWLEGRRFMERGRAPSFSVTGGPPRLRWLEGAATSDGVGELRSAPLAGDEPPLRLALNVRLYDEIAPGRLLVISNAAFRGVQNRLIVIDEAARAARWVADGARDFLYIPGTRDMLVRVVTGPGSDIRRLPIPY